MNFTEKEKQVLESVILDFIHNGNTVNPIPSVPSPEQYKIAFSIMQKIQPT